MNLNFIRKGLWSYIWIERDGCLQSPDSNYGLLWVSWKAKPDSGDACSCLRQLRTSITCGEEKNILPLSGHPWGLQTPKEEKNILSLSGHLQGIQTPQKRNFWRERNWEGAAIDEYMNPSWRGQDEVLVLPLTRGPTT